MTDIVERFHEISRRDDCFDHMVPSDVRELLGEIERLRAGLLEIRRRRKDMPGVTCGMDDVIDHALPSLSETDDE